MSPYSKSRSRHFVERALASVHIQSVTVELDSDTVRVRSHETGITSADSAVLTPGEKSARDEKTDCESPRAPDSFR
jgi:hypothetical protein